MLFSIYSGYQLPVTSLQLPVTSYQLPVTSYQLPVYSLPVTSYQFTVYQGKFILNLKQLLMLDFVALNPTYNSQNSAIDGIFVGWVKRSEPNKSDLFNLIYNYVILS